MSEFTVAPHAEGGDYELHVAIVSTLDGHRRYRIQRLREHPYSSESIIVHYECEDEDGRPYWEKEKALHQALHTLTYGKVEWPKLGEEDKSQEEPPGPSKAETTLANRLDLAEDEIQRIGRRLDAILGSG